MKKLKDAYPEPPAKPRTEAGRYRIVLVDSRGKQPAGQIGTAEYLWNRDCPNPYNATDEGAWEVATKRLYLYGFDYDRAEVYLVDEDNPVRLVAAMQFHPGKRRSDGDMTFTFDEERR